MTALEMATAERTDHARCLAPEAIPMAITGRAIAIGELGGPGLPVITGRLTRQQPAGIR